jgi:hypothetical protein
MRLSELSFPKLPRQAITLSDEQKHMEGRAPASPLAGARRSTQGLKAAENLELSRKVETVRLSIA